MDNSAGQLYTPGRLEKRYQSSSEKKHCGEWWRIDTGNG